MVNCGRFDGEHNREAFERDRRVARVRGSRQAGGQLQAARLAALAPALLGLPDPDHPLPDHGLVPVPDDQLPVGLPDIEDYAPRGRSPLAAAEDWVNTTARKCGGPAKRETDTMDTFVDSSWYFLRYCDAHNDEAPWDREIVDCWMPVDQYIGGIEHAILHLMYARFFTKALADLELVGFQEPFANLFTQGMITRDGREDVQVARQRREPVSEYVERYGADTLRTYVLYLGPIDQDADWSDEGAGGIHRFLGGCGGWPPRWRRPPSRQSGRAPRGEPTELLRKAHWAIDKVVERPGRPLRLQHRDRRGDRAGERLLPPPRRADADAGGPVAAALRGGDWRRR